MIDVGIRSSYVASWYAAPILTRQDKALIVSHRPRLFQRAPVGWERWAYRARSIYCAPVAFGR